MSQSRTVIVVGAGVVGVSCAWQLQTRGHRVMLVDCLEPGEACSYGNAGVISVSSCIPMVLPGTWKKLPGWLLARNGPLAVDWRRLPALAEWFAEAQRGATPSAVEKAAKALRGLHGQAVEDHFVQAEAAGCRGLLQPCGYLHVYRSEGAFEADRSAWKLRCDLGLQVEEVERNRLREIEPALADCFTRGVLLSGHARARDPGGLVKALALDFERRQGCILRAEVKTLVPCEGGGVVATLADRELKADTLVLAAGVWSAELAAALGHRFPLVAERGYHVMYAEPGISLNNAVMFAEEKFVANSMAGGLRVAGTAEFTTDSAKPANRRREIMLERLAGRYLPDLNLSRGKHWVGSRPSLPDTLPVIGRSHLHRNVILAFGHGHTGLTASATTARIVAALVSEENPPIDISPFRPERFGVT